MVKGVSGPRPQPPPPPPAAPAPGTTPAATQTQGTQGTPGTQTAPAATPAPAAATTQPAAETPPPAPRAADAAVAGQGRAALDGQLRQQQVGTVAPPIPAAPRDPLPPGAPPPAAPATPNSTQPIAPNASGPEVNTLQTNLNTWRAANGRTPIAVDGQMGPETRGALREYERDSGIPEGRGQSAGASALVQERLALEGNPNFQRLPEATRDQALQQMNAHPDNQAGRDNIRNLTTGNGFNALNATHQGEALNALSTNPNDAVHLRNIQDLTNSQTFRGTSAANQTRVLNMLGTHGSNTHTGQQLVQLATSERFSTLPADDQTRTLNVFSGTTSAGRTHLQSLLARDTPDGRPALLSRGINPNSPTLLQELDRQSATSLDSRLPAGLTRAQVSENVLAEVADPGRHINQANRGTCSMTTASYDLARSHPAEYARLQTDLTTTGQTRLANGTTMSVPPTAWAADGPGSNRSTGERLLQSSLMNQARPGYTNSPPYTINNPGPPPTTTTNPDGWPDRPGSGLTPAEQAPVISAMRNHTYTVGNYSAMNTAITNGRGPVPTQIGWGSGAHVVDVTRIENGRVYYHNPWGGNPSRTPGAVPGPPPRTNENVQQAEESMTVAQFQALHQGSQIRQ